MDIGRAEEETRQDCHIWGSDLRVDNSKIMAEVLVLGWGKLYNAGYNWLSHKGTLQSVHCINHSWALRSKT